ncbi:MAG: FeoA domain-containing protein [Spirochaetales bacterium]|nr:FeoA domain-containing protein [Spirochaetales bacterium]
MQLSELRPRDRFRIQSVRVGREIGRRLADMGFTEGTEGVIVRRGGFGGPMQIRIREYDLLIRKEEAARVDVELVESGCRGHGFGRRRRGGYSPEFD